MTRLKLVAMSLLLIAGLFLTACSTTNNNTPSAQDNTIQVTATTGMIADIAANVGGEFVTVNALMGPGVDPHLYKASQGDIAKLEEADIILYNGLNLEGKMADIFVRMASKKPAVQVTELIDEGALKEPPEFDGHYDPHVWFDVQLWMKVVERVRDAFIELDPTHKNGYTENAAAYLSQLEELDQYAKEQLALIPKESRVLVTAHDAFGYLGDAYDLEVLGLQGISTDAEYGLADVQELVDLLAQRNIKAVFVESSVSSKAIEAVVEGAKKKGHQVTIGGELFSDAMGDKGTEEGTYIGMVRHNIDTIVSALK
ncbi:metal ABC transporter solute-binding protein, Zn/Mn family [Ammoniphilus sp. CFH 90114]|uniref:metal ABC transporter solute-binding protein, Zn/Mn family n=1 Tax=Ammoniphilus sp. CFH 90114 TaxID=2493665 RepID=UPI00100E7217|nr:zinc ABC transporter substrate-binding protein [Ammoniphilus sp. CFH 90114]RXT04166.1 manganese transporter [Ammoniphilus sp. CFH 90114]